MKTATQEISRRIIELVASGVDVVDAMKTVCGAETVDAMISDLYDGLTR